MVKQVTCPGTAPLTTTLKVCVPPIGRVVLMTFGVTTTFGVCGVTRMVFALEAEVFVTWNVVVMSPVGGSHFSSSICTSMHPSRLHRVNSQSLTLPLPEQ